MKKTSQAQRKILRVIREAYNSGDERGLTSKALNPSELAEHLDITPGAVVTSLKAMHKKGILAWSPEEDCYVTFRGTYDAIRELD